MSFSRRHESAIPDPKDSGLQRAVRLRSASRPARVGHNEGDKVSLQVFVEAETRLSETSALVVGVRKDRTDSRQDVLSDTPLIRILRRVMGKPTVEDELHGIETGPVVSVGFATERNFRRALEKANAVYLFGFDPDYFERQE